MGGRGSLSPAMKAGKTNLESALDWVVSRGVKTAGDHTRLYQNLMNNPFVVKNMDFDFSGGWRGVEADFTYKKVTITNKSGRFGNYLTFTY